MTDPNDDRFRELARELRREDAASAPSFESVWGRAQDQAATRPPWETWWRPLAATAAAAVVVVAVSTGLFDTAPPLTGGDEADEMSLTTWRAPSGDLLEIEDVGLLDLSEPVDLLEESGAEPRNLRLPTDGLLGNFDAATPLEREM